MAFDLGFGQWLLAGLSVSGDQVQDCLCYSLGTPSVQGHAVWTLQCTSYISKADGPGPTGITMVPLPGLSRRYYYLAPGGGCEVLFSPGLSVCLCVCVCVFVCVSGQYFGILFLSLKFMLSMVRGRSLIFKRSRSQGRYIAF